MGNITKAIIPVAGLGTRFLPLSKAVPKELWPLVDRPLAQYAAQEAAEAGISEIIFVVNKAKAGVVNYFKRSQKLDKVLRQRKKQTQLKELEKIEALLKNVSISSVSQKLPLGDGHAILQAKKFVGNEPCCVLFPDDVIWGETPCLSQISRVFKTTQRPVLALCEVDKERIQNYGIAAGEKIANRLYKIKKIVEKPLPEKAPSNLAIVSRYIITPETFDYLKKTPASPKGEIILANALAEMLKDGKLIYGLECKGKWLECGTKLEWLKSHFYLCLKHPEYGPKLKEFIKKEKLL